MTPRERAEALTTWGPAAIEAGERLIASAVLEERAAVVAYLLGHCSSLAWTLSPVQVADRLKRGEHLDAGGRAGS